MSDDFHVFGYHVGDVELTVYFDGASVSHAPHYRSDTSDKFFWMFNLAMGGGWPIDVPPSRTYAMQIQYIRIFSADPDAKPILHR